jgi:hypothetical protein
LDHIRLIFFQLKMLPWRVLLLGLLIRFLLMPFTTHSDLLYTYWDAHLFLFHHKFDFGLQISLLSIHAVFLQILSPFLPPHNLLWLHSPDASLINPFKGEVGWFAFVDSTQIYRTLFFLKMPYLFFDLGIVLILHALENSFGKTISLIKYWWLNPILLFAVYVFGRHEIITLFFVFLSIYLVRHDKWVWSLLSLGVAIALRYYALFLLPFYVFSAPWDWKKRVEGILIGLIPWMLVNLFTQVISASTEVSKLINLPHDNYLLAVKFSVAAWDNIYLFPLIYFLLLLHRFYNLSYSWILFIKYNLTVIFLMFAFSYSGQSPQYWTWLLPWIVIAIAYDRRLISLHMFQIGLLIIYSFIGNREIFGYLFAPLAPKFFWSLPSPAEIISDFASPETVISLARTAFSAVTLWMLYLFDRRCCMSEKNL